MQGWGGEGRGYVDTCRDGGGGGYVDTCTSSRRERCAICLLSEVIRLCQQLYSLADCNTLCLYSLASFIHPVTRDPAAKASVLF